MQDDDVQDDDDGFFAWFGRLAFAWVGGIGMLAALWAFVTALWIWVVDTARHACR